MALPFPDKSFDVYTISFGIRNVVRIPDALREAYRVLRPGGRLMVLEFSRIPNDLMQWAYDRYSFNVIPVMGQVVAGDRDSYQYLVESIRKFPDQETFAGMIRAAGFGQVKYRNPDDGWPACIRAGSCDRMRARTTLSGWCGRWRRWSARGPSACLLAAFEAPASLRAVARVLGWPFKWLGHKGDLALPGDAGADGAGAGLHQVRADPFDPPRHRGRGTGAAAEVPAGQAAALPDAGRARDGRGGAGRPGGREFLRVLDPVAAASIAQVHHARLADTGRRWRSRCCGPGIARAFRKDIDAFYLTAWMIQTLAPMARRLRPMEVVAHFEGVVMGELDLRLESAAAAEFAANTAQDKGFRVPVPVWHLSGRQVMTIGWVEGASMADNAALDAAGHDRRELAGGCCSCSFPMRCETGISTPTCIRGT